MHTKRLSEKKIWRKQPGKNEINCLLEFGSMLHFVQFVSDRRRVLNGTKLHTQIPLETLR